MSVMGEAELSRAPGCGFCNITLLCERFVQALVSWVAEDSPHLSRVLAWFGSMLC